MCVDDRVFLSTLAALGTPVTASREDRTRRPSSSDRSDKTEVRVTAKNSPNTKKITVSRSKSIGHGLLLNAMAHPRSFDSSVGYDMSTVEEYDVGAGMDLSCSGKPTTRPHRRGGRGGRDGGVRERRAEHAIAGPESGSYVSFEIADTGPAGTADYDRAMWESKMARENPNLLAAKTDRELDVSWHELIVPKKPQAVSLAGMTVFGTDGPTTTARGMTTDLRGEAVDRYVVDVPPIGAAVSGKMGSVRDSDESRLSQPRAPHRRAQVPLPRRPERHVPARARSVDVEAARATAFDRMKAGMFYVDDWHAFAEDDKRWSLSSLIRF
jgi:hypothetical protein